MTTENWREEFDKEWKEGLLVCFGYENPESSREKRVVAEQAYFKLISSIEALLSKERKEAMKLNYWDKEKRNEVLDEVKKEVEKKYDERAKESEWLHYSDISTILENLKVK